MTARMVWDFAPDNGLEGREFTDDAHALALLTGANRDPARAVESLKAEPGTIFHCSGGTLRYIRATNHD